ncbi:hypothetical protein MA16_Dca025206 [Dendrobium catenatum]|uniref:Uncharacterized protein n=1 Tax=Dendrobium catenatum TaxID=906689 RepID=A0A2I0V9Z8_9ASPA|nr:hypothetical protein MA16_Dca025206 [Dendrobium catenatum]
MKIIPNNWDITTDDGIQNTFHFDLVNHNLGVEYIFLTNNIKWYLRRYYGHA